MSRPPSEWPIDDGVELVGDDVAVELFDDRSEEGAGGVGAGRLAGEAIDLHEVKAVVGGELCGFGGPDFAGRGEAGDEEDVRLADGALLDDGEARGRECRAGGDGQGGARRFAEKDDAGENEGEGSEPLKVLHEGCLLGTYGA